MALAGVIVDGTAPVVLYPPDFSTVTPHPVQFVWVAEVCEDDYRMFSSSSLQFVACLGSRQPNVWVYSTSKELPDMLKIQPVALWVGLP